MSGTISKGTVIGGEYELEEKIGEGGFGRVWKAQRLSDGKKTAIKQPVYQGASASQINKYFRRERDALQQIANQGNHPSIMRLVEDIQHNGSLFLVLSLVEGQEFQDYINDNGRMSDEAVRNFGIKLSEAMSFLHEQIEYMYRDLKPDNIIVDSNGDPQIIDFTTAREYSDDAGQDASQPGMKVDKDRTVIKGGTKYKPPELLGNSPYVHGPQIDVYSIGKILYKARIGWAPDEDGKGPQDNDTSVAQYLNDIIINATQTAADDRYRSAAALKRALEERNATPAKQAIVKRLSNDTRHTIEPGETIGRLNRGPPTNIAIDDDYISKVHCRFDLNSQGDWVLEEKSTNGTFVYRDSIGEWMYYLSNEGQESLEDAGHHKRLTQVKGTTCDLRDGDTIALVDPDYKNDPYTWFQFSRS